MEAAHILNMSAKQVAKLIRDGKLSSRKTGSWVYIPREEVHRLYGGIHWGAKSTQSKAFQTRINSVEPTELGTRVKSLEQDLEVLKLGLGFGAPKRTRGLEELSLLRQKFLDLLGKKKWENKQISTVADDLISVNESELIMLAVEVGEIAWIPLDQLAQRMLSYIESRDDYPTKGLDVLHTRLTRARDRFLGLVFATCKAPDGLGKDILTLHGLLEPPGGVDKAILAYIFDKK